MASFLGAGPVADAFVVAFRFPNLGRRLFAEGAFNAAFVPLFSKRVEGEGLPAAKAFAEESLGALLFILIAITVVCEIFMRPIVMVIAPGFVGDAEKFELTVLFTRIALPYLLFICLTAR